MFRLYKSTIDKLYWGRQYLNAAFFQQLRARWKQNLCFVAAQRGDELVAGAINVQKNGVLYGRYWGCFEEHRFLHFNVCLYHSVEQCIARGVRVFEGGAGGEHKLARGFVPSPTFTAFELFDARLDEAVRRYLQAERPEREAALERWRAESGLLKPRAANSEAAG